MSEKKAYTQAFQTGKYDKATGLLGKYDNVRRFWEDQVTAIFLRPALNDLVARKKKRLERLRILDVGCGSGDGYDLIMGVTTKHPGIHDYIVNAVTDDMLKEYVGIDLNENLIQQALEYYGDKPKLRFETTDISQGMIPGILGEEPPFDLYFTSFGTLSHFTSEQCIKIIADILRHAPDQALFMGDWLGRYTFEWQDLWHHPADQEYFMDYRISYIYPEEERAAADVAAFPLKLVCRREIEDIIKKASQQAGVEIKPLVYFDRSIFIGRHLDTGDYNKNCPKLRGPVNALFETYVRTDLENLLVDYVPRTGFEHLNNFFESFFMSSNALVKYTMGLLGDYDCDTGKLECTPDILPYYPKPLQEAMETMRRVVEAVGWLKWGDVRANLIESVLGFALRKLEMELQPGTGMGHGLVGIFEIRK
ncbi:MAG: class I SAM-dependent methyltransferase [Desulfobacteraceae bacterium]|jgi:SAM-dependent methyltransferase|nr:class I SAM-dependent methyltransferase [Desulfobacteraceae bacterium]MDH3721363.1 class I SAM-dependent methyltransferase [Desulfobacteraceae bacterium]MDH3837585.1 class I SAM-dependent methyltransferase [Desulfobacteraceae bacterium]MDH3873173.1 class I SAM-dependent methyltransferase [Desulfobacteraceae bacterium]MDH3881717.1 class I SAM-dependent methyltransferase [Desulfobacteraceae bacterium]